jgi:nitrite reductase/ring-hydroxylating ferredoxin subunit/uncharacterized membrane protein
MLIPFPIAFFTGTFVFHIWGWAGNQPGLLTTAYYTNLAGIIMAVITAIPGFIDFLYTVPPRSSGKKRAAKHGIINVLMLVCFTVAFFLRSSTIPNHSLILALEFTGMVLMIIAGWMGGTLVYRNQIGVDPRYANAGKWKEAFFDTDSGEIEVATIDELKTNAMKLLHLKNRRIVLARTEQNYVAFEDRCTHKGGSLAGGSTICGVVQCPWHGSQFDTATGEVKSGPAREPIKTYTVKEVQGKIVLVLQ